MLTNVAKKFYYQHVFQSEPEWPPNIDLTDDTKALFRNTSSLDDGFVHVSINSISSFIQEALPRGYKNRLEMFYRVFDFEAFRHKR
jgi:hypothetical protein